MKYNVLVKYYYISSENSSGIGLSLTLDYNQLIDFIIHIAQKIIFYKKIEIEIDICLI